MVEVVTDGQPTAFFNIIKMGKNEESDTLVLGHKKVGTPDTGCIRKVGCLLTGVGVGNTTERLKRPPNC